MPRMIKKVRCDTVVFYSKNPLETCDKPQISGFIVDFVDAKLYKMPQDVKNPVCWAVRCDRVWRDFKKLYPAARHQEGEFWATVRDRISGVRSIPWVFKECLWTEDETTTTIREWDEVSYELREVGYDGCPERPEPVRTLEK